MVGRALEGVRVVEFCDEIGSYCGRLLADLGAEVIKVEPPGGARQRHTPPFIAAAGAGVDSSLAFWVHNTSKKSVVLDLDLEPDRVRARVLALTADVVLEDNPVGYLAGRGLGYEDLRGAKPSLVYTSVTGFGQDGPHARWAYSDIVGQAVGGIMTLAGELIDPPNMVYGSQSDISASIHAAQGTMIALLHAEATGEGQLVDVSAQESLSMSQETAMQTWDFQKRNRTRTGELGSLPIRLPALGAYPAADGWVFLFVLSPGGAELPDLVAWMRERGMAEDLDDEPYRSLVGSLNMRTLTMLVASGPEEIASKIGQLMHINEVIAKFIKSLPAAHVYEEGQRRSLMVGIISTPRDLAENHQLRARDWFVTFDAPGRGPVEFTGPPYRLSETPALISRPPALGEHSRAVLAALTGGGS